MKALLLGDNTNYISNPISQFCTSIVNINDFLSSEEKTFLDYEEESTKLELDQILVDFKGVEVYLLIYGGDNKTGASLVLSEWLVRNHSQLNIVYIKPELEFTDDETNNNHIIVSQALQEKARAGKIKRFFFLDMAKFNVLLQEQNVSLYEYWDKFGMVVADLVHRIYWFSQKQPFFGKIRKPEKINRISTFGIMDSSLDSIYALYEMELPKEVEFYFLVSENKLKNDTQFLKQVKDRLSVLAGYFPNDIKMSYGIYPTNYDFDYYFCKLNTNLVQESAYLKEFKK